MSAIADARDAWMREEAGTPFPADSELMKWWSEHPELHPAPNAIRPGRVLVLNEYQQRHMLEAFREFASPVGVPEFEAEPRQPWALLADMIETGDEFLSPTDELVRLNLRKRIVEAHVKELDARIAELTEAVVAEMHERGDRSGKHAATGANYRIDEKVWAKLALNVDGMSREEEADARADLKRRIAPVLRDLGLDELVPVTEDWNLNKLSAVFRGLVNEHREQQRELPEHERRPMTVAEFLPPELEGLVELTDAPKIVVTGGGS